jgi:hypothetical protein
MTRCDRDVSPPSVQRGTVIHGCPSLQQGHRPRFPNSSTRAHRCDATSRFTYRFTHPPSTMPAADPPTRFRGSCRRSHEKPRQIVRAHPRKHHGGTPPGSLGGRTTNGGSSGYLGTAPSAPASPRSVSEPVSSSPSASFPSYLPSPRCCTNLECLVRHVVGHLVDQVLGHHVDHPPSPRGESQEILEETRISNRKDRGGAAHGPGPWSTWWRGSSSGASASPCMELASVGRRYACCAASSSGWFSQAAQLIGRVTAATHTTVIGPSLCRASAPRTFPRRSARPACRSAS